MHAVLKDFMDLSERGDLVPAQGDNVGQGHTDDFYSVLYLAQRSRIKVGGMLWSNSQIVLYRVCIHFRGKNYDKNELS